MYSSARKSGSLSYLSLFARESYVCAVSAGALTRNEGAAAEVPLRPFPPWYFAESPLLRHGYGFSSPAVSPDHPRGLGFRLHPYPLSSGEILSMFAGHTTLIETSPRGVGKRRDGVDPHVPSVALSITTYHVYCYLFLNKLLKNCEGTKKYTRSFRNRIYLSIASVCLLYCKKVQSKLPNPNRFHSNLCISNLCLFHVENLHI